MKQHNTPDHPKRKKGRGSVLRFFVLIFVLAIMILGVACSIFSYQNVMNSITKKSADTAYSVSVILSDLYNSDYESENQMLQGSYFREDKRMKRISKLLQFLCKDMDLEYLYVFDVDEENNNYLCYFTAAADDDMNAKVSEERGFGTIVHVDSISQSIKDALHGSTEVNLERTNNEYGDVYSWYYPLHDSDGNVEYIVGADFSAKIIQDSIVQQTLQFCIPTLIVLLLVFTIVVLTIRHKVFLPLQLVASRMNHFIEDKDKAEPLVMKANNEVGAIADSFNKMRQDIDTYLAEINTLTTEQVQHQTQMEIAQRIQYGIVPAHTHIKEDAYEVNAIEQPCKNVGGDFYDCFLRGEQELCFLVGDVSGKGITAALFMVMTKTSIREKLMQGFSPAEALNSVNDEICQANPEGLFATVFVAVLHIGTGHLTYANAGHTLPVFFREQASFRKVDPGIPVGLFEDAGIINGEELFCPGDGILLYSDGVTEAVDPSDNFFGEERTLSAVREAKTAVEAAQSLQSAVKDFYQEREAFDDLTILAAFYRGYTAMVSLQPQLSELQSIKKLLQEMFAELSLLKKVLLVCDEIFTNIVTYSGADQIDFCCDRMEKKAVLLLADNGKAFDPTQADTVPKDFEEMDTGGMGIAMVRQMTDTMLYQRRSGKNYLLLTVPLTHE